ncbi:MAG: hypothetical protein M3Z98_00745 [Candidatus Dormibacteraeota bacterium]|nr:hypothetical protein [Candidatus Dormibacteraeota bacterium]
MLRRVRLLAVIATACGFALVGSTLSASASPATSKVKTNPKHFFWSHAATPDPNAASNDLIYHGGNAGPGAIGVEKTPAVYVVYWGSPWAAGFTTPDTDGTAFSSATLQTYVESFFAGIGGTPWDAVQTQYCRNVPAGTVNCAGIAGADYITNPTGQLKGTWTDPSPVPAAIVTLGLAENLVDDPIAAEASAAAAHFGYDPNATYIILTPPSTIGTGQPVYCGYHTQTTSVNGLGNAHTLQYSFIPFQNMSWPGIGSSGCGMHFVNKTSNAFGNGIFDGYSMVLGHEYAEAVTDPDNFLSNQDGWNDAQGSENGDKCAWNANSGNITLGANFFAVQPMWSNQAFDTTGNGCPLMK